MNGNDITRRTALGLGGALLAGCSLSRTDTVAPALPEMIVGRPWVPTRLKPPGDELVNSLEYEAEARLVLPEEIHGRIAGTNVEPFNRRTFLPRLNIPTLEMDLTTPLFGEPLFTPMLAGPVPEQGAYHADGELATVRGAAAANTVAIVSSRSSFPLEQIVPAITGPLWYGVYADGEGTDQALRAVDLGARVLFVNVGTSYRGPGISPSTAAPREPIDWRRAATIREGVGVPVVLRGILTPEEAARAVAEGFGGIVVSDHGADGLTGGPAPLDALAPVADAVGGRIPVLAEGSFRRGTDVLKGLILGARAIILNRPVAWSLAGYGADGVQWMFEQMQTELARNFAMIGAPRPDQLTRDLIRLHRAATA